MQSNQGDIQSMEKIIHSGGEASHNPNFPNAPLDWKEDHAVNIAQGEDIKLDDNHWEVIRALQEYFVRHENDRINTRELHDALDEKFHNQGGIKHLYELLPGGPIAQGCRLAGLQPPAGAADSGFGSVI